MAKRRVVMNQLVMLTRVSFEKSQGCLAVWLFEDWTNIWTLMRPEQKDIHKNLEDERGFHYELLFSGNQQNRRVGFEMFG